MVFERLNLNIFLFLLLMQDGELTVLMDGYFCTTSPSEKANNFDENIGLRH